MKFVKVTALAAAVMASFGVQAELTALEDTALETVTGQAGITIEQSIAGLDIYYVDADGAAVTTTPADAENNGGAINVKLNTVAATLTGTNATVASGGAIKMDIDVVSGTPGSSTQRALRVSQQLTASAGTAYLAVTGLTIASTGSSTTTGNTAFGAALSEQLVGTASSATMGDIYINMGTGIDMYVYGH
jgi:hypothetical protein